jgi:filamentous hemagglutinin family protein
MASSWNVWYWRLAGASLFAMGYAIASSEDCALAQITPDGTLGAESSIVTPTAPGETVDVILGGARRGANLFHSFEQFSVLTGREASFNNALDIQNIISRVTGGSVSNIDGLLRANGSANLFLLNPNGIIFGPNASLNIGGSFVASTASSLNFADGTSFSATVQATPLLTVSVPIGLQYGGTAGNILNQSQAPNSSGEPVGLQVQQRETLALVGGDVSLDGGDLQAAGGRVELGGLAAAGTVELNEDGSLSFPDGVTRADVSITNGAFVDVRAGGGGSIAVNARNLELSTVNGLLAGIGEGLGTPGVQAGDITLNVTEAITMESSRIRNNVNSDATGNSGDINIMAGSLSLTNGSDIDSEVNEDGVGNAGDINISARSVSIVNDSELETDTRGVGDVGDIAITATEDVVFDQEGDANSRVRGGIGNGGTSISVLGRSLSVTTLN